MLFIPLECLVGTFFLMRFGGTRSVGTFEYANKIHFTKQVSLQDTMQMRFYFSTDQIFLTEYFFYKTNTTGFKNLSGLI